MSRVLHPLDAVSLVASSDPDAAWIFIEGISEAMDDNTVIIMPFDYQALDISTRDFVQQKTGEIRAVAKRAAGDMIAIGQALIEVKQCLKHGQFGDWLQAEFGWKERMARDFMQVARRFGKTAFNADMNLAPTVLRLLAAPSTSNAAIDEAISLLQAGKKVDTQTAKEIIRRHKAADEADAIDLIIETAPGGTLANALDTTHIKALAEVAQTFAETHTLDGALPLQEAVKAAATTTHYEAVKRQETYITQKRDAKRAKQLEQHIAREQVPLGWDAAQAWRLIECDIEHAADEINAESVDWIITDPPYGHEHLELYAALSRLAAHALKPGGSVLCMSGQSVLPQVMAQLGECLAYHWLLAYTTPGGQSAQLWRQRVNTFWKPVLWYTKGEYAGGWIGDVVKSEVNANEKALHHWQQSESGMTDLMKRFVLPEQMILDPFCGASTTGVVALRLKCHYVGMDNDAAALAVSRERLLACTHPTA